MCLIIKTKKLKIERVPFGSQFQRDTVHHGGGGGETCLQEKELHMHPGHGKKTDSGTKI